MNALTDTTNTGLGIRSEEPSRGASLAGEPASYRRLSSRPAGWKTGVAERACFAVSMRDGPSAISGSCRNRRVPGGGRDAWRALALGAGLSLATMTVSAFPPAPHHTLFGMVRNQWGTPLDVAGAEVFIQSGEATGIQVNIAASTEPGVNYRMRVPMDSGRALDRYQSSALQEAEPFQLKVQIGSTTYVPLEMALTAHALGEPAGSTHLDLTLGVDTDGDGLPDAWEQALLEMLGGDLTDVTPDGDLDGDGLSNLNEFRAGTQAFDPNEGFRLAFMELSLEGDATLDFFAVRGRTYRLEVTSDLREWTPTSFHVIDRGVPGPLVEDFTATSYRQVQVRVPLEEGVESNRHFRAVVQ